MAAARYELDPVLHSAGGVGAMLVDAVERHGPRTAFIASGRQVSYQAFGADVSQAMQFLAGLGLTPGDAVMQLCANSYEMFVLMAACFIGGYVSVTPHYGSSADDQRYILQDCGAVLLVTDAPRAAVAAGLAAESGVRALCHDAGADLPPVWPAVRAYAPQPLLPQDSPQDMIRLIYTGGTTGRPKGVVTLSSQLAFASLLHVAEQGFTPDDRLLVLSPISHGAGSFIIPVLSKGGAVVIQTGFDPAAVIGAVTQLKVTVLFLVPTMLYVLMDAPRLPGTAMSSLRRIIYAASPISPPRLAQALRLFGPILSQNYGLTEVPGTVLTLTPEDHLDTRADRLGSAGKPYPCVSVTLLDDEDKPIGRGGGVGEICIRAPHATPAYWRQPELTAQLWRGGWLHTGDMAFQTADGYVHIVDRKKDMIISGGFNVYPQEVENALALHPAVSQAAIIGIPHEKWGEAVHAVVVLKHGASATDAELIDYVKQGKGPVLAPKTVAFTDLLPLTGLGKIDKKALRAPFWVDQSRSVS